MIAVAAVSGNKCVTASWDKTVRVHSISEDGHSIETVATQEYDDQAWLAYRDAAKIRQPTHRA